MSINFYKASGIVLKKWVFRFVYVCPDRSQTRQKPSVWLTTERHDYNNNNSAAIPAAYERAVGTETDERRGGGVVCSRTACRRLAGRPDPARPSPRPTHAYTHAHVRTRTQHVTCTWRRSLSTELMVVGGRGSLFFTERRSGEKKIRPQRRRPAEWMCVCDGSFKTSSSLPPGIQHRIPKLQILKYYIIF